jgi:hypothetical protein
MPWSLQSISCSELRFYETPELYGNKVRMEFLLRYLAERDGRFVETPALEWKEKIFMLDRAKRERWEFAADMYQHNPRSRTLSIWPRRYIEADKTLSDSSRFRGQSLLFNLKMQRVTLESGSAPTDELSANAVRDYLAKAGGFLRISIEDIPSVKTRSAAPGAQPRHLERLLLADCGIKGGGSRQRWAQYLSIDQSVPPMRWIRRCETRWFMNDLPTPAGFKIVRPPVEVSQARPADRSYGEYP